MTRISRLLCILPVVIAPGTGIAGTPVYMVKKAPHAVTADGVLDEPLWTYLDSVSLQECTAGDPPPEQGTLAKAAWDARSLYLAVITRDRDVWATITAHDGALFTEEMIEFFIDPDRDGKNYFEYEFNCKNALMDMFMYAPYSEPGQHADASWTSSKIEHKVVVHGTANKQGDVDSGMVLEAAIPWTDLKFSSVAAPQPLHGTRMSVNIYRGDGRATKTYSCWSPVGGTLPGSFHSPRLFGTFEFSDSLAMPKTGLGSQPPVLAAPKKIEIEWTARGKGLSIRYTLPRFTEAHIILSDLLGKTIDRAPVIGDGQVHRVYCDGIVGRSGGIYLLRLHGSAGTAIRRIVW